MRHKHLIALGFAALMLALSRASAEAQPHHGAGGYVSVIPHSPLLWGAGFHGGFYHPYYPGFGPWYPYPHPAFGLPPGSHPAVALRLQVNPPDASVFVDGYAAGTVDDYDGVFQRLRLAPGPHEIVIHHPRHRTLRQHIYYNPGSTQTIRHILEPLLPGETPEPQPVPHALRVYAGTAGQPGAPPVVGGNPPPNATRAGTLALRVQPGDATVLVDGESWRGPQTQDRLVIQLAEGPHRVRIEKPGFQAFVVDVEVRAGETVSFNVSLLSQ